MKKINIILALALISLLATVSCKDMNDNFKEYVESGETIYSNRVFGVTGFSGDNRVQIAGIIINASNVKDIVVTWKQSNGEKKELVFPYEKEDDADIVKMIVPDLEEGTYEFTVFSRDASGNKSVTEKVFATAYGDTYREKLSPRGIDAVTFGDGPEILNIEFNISNEYQRNTEVRYTDVNGVEKVAEVPASESSLNLTDLDPHQPIQYRTLYVPTLARKVKTEEKDENGEYIEIDVETTIDLFETEWANVEIPEIPKKITDEIPIQLTEEGLFTDAQDPGEGPIKNLIDGDTGSFFHMDWHHQTPFPHYIVVDLGKEVEGFKFSYTTRNNGRNYPEKIVLFGSQTFDGSTYDTSNATEIATIEEGLATGAAATYNSGNYTLDNKIRYLWFRIDRAQGSNAFIALSELSVTELVVE